MTSSATHSGSSAESSDSTAAVAHSGNGSLLDRGFLCLVATQFLGTVNDNVIRWLIVLIGKHRSPENQKEFVLSAGLVAFTLPFILLATHAGYFADRFSKRSVIVWCKALEVVVMLLGLAAIASGHLWFGLAVVAFAGAQTALFGPAKYGAIPELIRVDRIPAANGVMGLMTVSATAVGMMLGYWVFHATGKGEQRLDIAAAVLVGIAALGWGVSLGISLLRPANPLRVFPLEPVTETWHQLRTLFAFPQLARVAMGTAFFWAIGAIVQMNIDRFGDQMSFAGHLSGWITVLPLPIDAAAWSIDKLDTSTLLAVLTVGIGVGSILAGACSAGRVELGMVAYGALGMLLGAVGIALAGLTLSVNSPGAFFWSSASLLLIGFSAGFYTVPLDSFLQTYSPVERRGQMIAAGNFLAFSSMLAAAGLFYLIQPITRGDAATVFLIIAGLIVPVLGIALYQQADSVVRFTLWIASRIVYRIRVHGLENVPREGPALIVANHVTWIDGVLLVVTLPRHARYLVWGDFVAMPSLNWLARIMHIIPVKATDGPRALIRSLQTARQALVDGHLVVIFAEGQLSRTGQMNPFQRGLLRIVDGTDAPVIPTYLDGLWGSWFSYQGGTYLRKWPTKFPYPCQILFGEPLHGVTDVWPVQESVRRLGPLANELRKDRQMLLPRQMLRMMRRQSRKSKLADSSGVSLTGREVLLRSLGLRRILLKGVIQPDEQYVAALLPPSVGGVVVNATLALMRRISVNLNYTASAGVMNSCIAQVGARRVLTSRRVTDKLGVTLDAPFVFLEDLKDTLSLWDKLVVAFQAYVLPVFLLERWLGLTKDRPDDTLTVIFTSGSTGEPKGVMLTHWNIASNLEAEMQVFDFKQSDVMIGLLPFFHSFGYTVTLWSPLVLIVKAAYHFNPLDAKTVGELTQQHKGTVLLATPTFLRTYVKRCEPEQMKTLRLVIVGAEKLPRDLTDAFEARFGLRPLEGYGCTELSPLVSCNLPDFDDGRLKQVCTREGSVGRPLPGMAARIIDPDTHEELPIDTPGLLLIKGPNVMKGYLGKPELTAQVVRDGWYTTGDIARLDSDGYITITDRVSRFSKIGGEMVPHLLVEQKLAKIMSAGEDDAELRVVVTAVPDPRKGERLVVVHKACDKSLDAVCQELGESGLPNLWLPSRDSFMQVEAIPVLGTGKLDLKGVRNLALEQYGSEGSA
jgi:acyl-[acyl-carrier-protein]-phospholipid O-acyltransferase/long-chain-fatty-acid--[acyl-carrier-protein] ligase